VLLSDYVVDMKCRFDGRLWQMAVFAPVSGPTAYQLPNGGVHY
jgi:hypothetical protein